MSKDLDRGQFDDGVFLVDPARPDIDNPVPPWADSALKDDPGETDPTAPQDDQKATRYSDDFAYRVQRDIPVNSWVALARFHVDRGQLGIIYQLQTYAQGTNEDIEQHWYTTADPLYLQKLGIAPLHWMLTLEQRQAVQLQPRPRAFGSPPMVPHPQLGSWSDGRYTWSAINNRVRITVPEGQTARLWVGTPPELSIERLPILAGGRLVGLLQSYEHNPAAKTNTRKGW